jgi:glycosyltransferase involved in cell wall biosynthesis
MLKANPLISILICNYNYEKYITEALDSVALQDYDNIEVVIIDDGSKDNSVSTIQRFIVKNNKLKVRLIAKSTNQGICFARNEAIDESKGEYILFLDSDDTLPPEYISKMIDGITVAGADVAYADMRKFGDDRGETDYPEFSKDKLLLYNFVNISSLIKKSSLKKHRFDTRLNDKTLEDYDFWLGLAVKGLKFVKINSLYMNYRIQSESRNENYATPDVRILQFIDIWHYSLLKYKKYISDELYENTLLNEMKYRITELGRELNGLNKIVHTELLPELDTRSKHIAHIDESLKQTKELNDTLQMSIDSIYSSVTYRMAKIITKPLRLLKKNINSKNGKI